MDKQAQIKELASHIRAFNKCNYSPEQYAERLMDNGYTRSTPLVALDKNKLIKLIDDDLQTAKMSVFLGINNNADFDIASKYIATTIIDEFGTPSARIPSEDEIIETLKNINLMDRTSLRIAREIRKLCEEVNKGE